MTGIEAFFATLSLDQVGWAALVTLFFFLFFTGRIVPKGHLDAERKNSEYWREAWVKSEASGSELLRQNGRLLVSTRANSHLIKSISPGEDELEDTV